MVRDMEFSKRLKQLRESKGLPQKELAERVGLTPATISAYEKGIKNPSLDAAVSIAKKFEVSLDKLCGLENEVKISNCGDVASFLIKLSEEMPIPIIINLVKEIYSELGRANVQAVGQEIYDAWAEKIIINYTKIKITEGFNNGTE